MGRASCAKLKKDDGKIPGNSEGNCRNQRLHVRRERRWFTAGESPARELFAPPGSNRSGGEGNEAVGASGVEGRLGDLASMQARNVSGH